MIPILAPIATYELSDIVAGVLAAGGAIGSFFLHIQLQIFNASINSRLRFFKSSLTVSLVLKYVFVFFGVSKALIWALFLSFLVLEHLVVVLALYLFDDCLILFQLIKLFVHLSDEILLHVEEFFG